MIPLAWSAKHGRSIRELIFAEMVSHVKGLCNNPASSEPEALMTERNIVSTKSAIIAAINQKVGANASVYRVGLTRYPYSRKSEWGAAGTVQFWVHWETASLSDAKAIETYFINERGMKGGTGGDLSGSGSMYVYVFLP